MKHATLFRTLASMTLWCYCAAIAQAGQFVSQDDRAWVRETLKQKDRMEEVPASNSIAVLYFANKTKRDKLSPLQKGMAIMLQNDLAKVSQLRVVERTRVQALFEAMNMTDSALIDTASLAKIGRLLGAYYILNGDILEGKIKDLEINSALFDVPFKTSNELATATGALGELHKLEKTILFNALRQMKITVPAEKRTQLEQPLSKNTPALLAFFLGMDHADRGEYETATRMLEQALVEDPKLEMARSALQELKKAGLAVTVPSAKDTADTLPPVDNGPSTKQVVGVGLLVAAVGGGAALALGGGGGGDNSSGGQTTPSQPTDTTAPRVEVAGGKQEVTCNDSLISFVFNEKMAADGGRIELSRPSLWTAETRWGSPTLLEVTVHGPYDDATGSCTDTTALTVSLEGYKDEAGNAMGSKSFTFRVIEP